MKTIRIKIKRMVGVGILGVVGSWGMLAQSNQITLVANPPAPGIGVNATIIGVGGIETYYYWIIAKYPRGNSIPLGPIVAAFANKTLTNSNYVKLNWNPAPGALGYDVVKSSSPELPPTGNIALALNISTVTVNDKGTSLSSYTISSIGAVTGVEVLDASTYLQPRYIWDWPIMVPAGGIWFNDGTNQTTAGGGGGAGVVVDTTDPTGACTNGALAMNTTNATIWDCNGGWRKILDTSGLVVGCVIFNELPTNGSTAITECAPDTVSASYTLLKPASVGAIGQAQFIQSGAGPYQLGWLTPIQKVFSGSQALGTTLIAANDCATPITVTATGIVTTDTVNVTANTDISVVTGYGYTSTDGLIVYWRPVTNGVIINQCNRTGAGITPGAVTVNILVVR